MTVYSLKLSNFPFNVLGHLIRVAPPSAVHFEYIFDLPESLQLGNAMRLRLNHLIKAKLFPRSS